MTIENGCNTYIFQILREEHDGKFYFKVDILSILPNPVELSHHWVLTNFNYRDPSLYDRLFDESEEVTFEVTPGRKNVGIIIKPVPGDPKLYVFRIERVILSSFRFFLTFSLFVTKLQQIILNITLHPYLK